MEISTILITASGIMLMIIAPGILISRALFPKAETSDQLLYSSCLGLVPQLLLYVGNTVLHFKITTLTTVMTIAFVSVIAAMKILSDKVGKSTTT